MPCRSCNSWSHRQENCPLNNNQDTNNDNSSCGRGNINNAFFADRNPPQVISAAPAADSGPQGSRSYFRGRGGRQDPPVYLPNNNNNSHAPASAPPRAPPPSLLENHLNDHRQQQQAQQGGSSQALSPSMARKIKLFVQYEHTRHYEEALKIIDKTSQELDKEQHNTNNNNNNTKFLLLLFQDPTSNSMLLDTRDVSSLRRVGRCIVIPYLEYKYEKKEREALMLQRSSNNNDNAAAATATTNLNPLQDDCDTSSRSPTADLLMGIASLSANDKKFDVEPIPHESNHGNDDDNDVDASDNGASSSSSSASSDDGETSNTTKILFFPPSYLPALSFHQSITTPMTTTTSPPSAPPSASVYGPDVIVVPKIPTLADLVDADIENGVVGISGTEYMFLRRSPQNCRFISSTEQLFYFREPQNISSFRNPPQWSEASHATLFSSNSDELRSMVNSVSDSIDQQLQAQEPPVSRFKCIFNLRQKFIEFFTPLLRYFPAVFLGDQNNQYRKETGFLTLSCFKTMGAIDNTLAEGEGKVHDARNNTSSYNNSVDRTHHTSWEGKPLLWMTGDLPKDIFDTSMVKVNVAKPLFAPQTNKETSNNNASTSVISQQQQQPSSPTSSTMQQQTESSSSASTSDSSSTGEESEAEDDWIVACDKFGTGIKEDAFSITKNEPAQGDFTIRHYYLTSNRIMHSPETCLKEVADLVNDRTGLTVSCNCGEVTEFRFVDQEFRVGRKGQPLGLNRGIGRSCIVVESVFKAADRPNVVDGLLDKQYVIDSSRVYFREDVCLNDELTITGFSSIGQMEEADIADRTIETFQHLQEFCELALSGPKLGYLCGDLKWRHSGNISKKKEHNNNDNDNNAKQEQLSTDEHNNNSDDESQQQKERQPNTPLPLPSEPIRALIATGNNACDVRRQIDMSSRRYNISYRTSCNYIRDEQPRCVAVAEDEEDDIEINIELYMYLLGKISGASATRFLYSTPQSPLYGIIPLYSERSEDDDGITDEFEYMIANYFKDQFSDFLTEDEIRTWLSLSAEKVKTGTNRNNNNNDDDAETSSNSSRSISQMKLKERVKGLWDIHGKKGSATAALPSLKEFSYFFDTLKRDYKHILYGTNNNNNSSLFDEVVFSPLKKIDDQNGNSVFGIETPFEPHSAVDINSIVRKRVSYFWQTIIGITIKNANNNKTAPGITVQGSNQTIDDLGKKLYIYNKECIASKKTIERSLSLSMYLVEAGPNTTIVQHGRIYEILKKKDDEDDDKNKEKKKKSKTSDTNNNNNNDDGSSFRVALNDFAGFVEFPIPAASASELERKQIAPLKKCHVVIARDPDPAKEVATFCPPPPGVDLGPKNVSQLIRKSNNKNKSIKISQWLEEEQFPRGKIALSFIEPCPSYHTKSAGATSSSVCSSAFYENIPHTLTLVRLFGFDQGQPEITRIPVLVSFKPVDAAAYLDVKSGHLNAPVAPWMRWQMHYLNVCNRFGFYLVDVANRDPNDRGERSAEEDKQ